MYQELIKELNPKITALTVSANKVKKEINAKKIRIKEINILLDRTRAGEDSDFSIFSPRSIDNINASDINAKKEEIASLQNEIDVEQSKLDTIVSECDLYKRIVDTLMQQSADLSSVNQKLDTIRNNYDAEMDIQKQKYETRISGLEEKFNSQFSEISELLRDLTYVIDEDPNYVKNELLNVVKILKDL